MEVAMSHKKLCSFILGFACLVAIPQRFVWAQDDTATAGKPVTAGSRTTSPGTKVDAQYSNNPPTLTPQQGRELEALWSKANRTGPIEPIHPAPMTTAAERGAEAGLPGTPAPNTFNIYRDSVIPASAIAGGYGFSSYTMEPSSGINGRYAFQTGNWYASRFDQDLNSGAGGWTFLNPFTLFGSGFCCDQVTTYLADWNREYWVLQYGDHLALANSPGPNLNSWCYYNINASWWGLDPASYSIDYNDMAFSKNYVYIASNIFGPNGGFGAILRLPITSLNACAAFNYNYYYDTTRFTFKPVQGATNVMYWGSNWGGGVNGSGFRVYSWAENSGTIFFNDRSVTPFNYEYRNNGQFCGSADGVVTSWCNYNDSRVKGGYRANGVIGFSYDVTQGSGFPFPYIRREYFRESDLAYLGNAQLWANWSAFQYGTFAPNNNGDIGGAFSWGGGCSGCTDYYPGTGYLIDDDFAPSQPWSLSYEIFGGGNTCTYGGIPRWGDYLTTRPDYPAGYAWVGTGWAIKGGNCGSSGAFSQPHNVVFGRGRDISNIGRWKNK
jgi:hypothetical protein